MSMNGLKSMFRSVFLQLSKLTVILCAVVVATALVSAAIALLMVILSILLA